MLIKNHPCTVQEDMVQSKDEETKTDRVDLPAGTPRKDEDTTETRSVDGGRPSWKGDRDIADGIQEDKVEKVAEKATKAKAAAVTEILKKISEATQLVGSLM